MKKIIAGALALLLALSVAIPTFAENEGATAPTGSSIASTDPATIPTGSITVSGDYTPQNVTSSISVDVTWTSMKFTYIAGEQGEWNADDQKYENVVAPHWKDEKSTITVTNHSNVDIVATFTSTKNQAVTAAVRGQFSKDSLLLKSSDEVAYDEAATASTEFSVDPTSDGIDKAYTKLLTVSVHIEKTNIIDATSMTAEDLQAALAEKLARGETTFTVALAEDANESMFMAIRAALDNDKVKNGSIDMTISGAKTVANNFLGAYKRGEEDHQNVNKLRSITLPDATTIGLGAFSNCNQLKRVSAPNVETVGASAFSGSGLTSIDLPVVSSVEGSAFGFCQKLTTVHLGAVTVLNDAVFWYCPALTSLTFDKPLTSVDKDWISEAPAEITLTLANGQKQLTLDSETQTYVVDADDMTGGDDVEFCKVTFKNITIAE